MSPLNDPEALAVFQGALTAPVYDVAVESPLEAAPLLSTALGNRVWFKREDLQPVFSFKLRGAYTKMAKLSPEALERGVVAASAGNHAQGVALAAGKLGCRAVIVMPVTTPAIKVEAVRRLGGEVRLVGDSFDEAAAYARKAAEEEGLTSIPPYDDPDVIAGQGTVGMELLRQRPGGWTRSSCRWAAAGSSRGSPPASSGCSPPSGSSGWSRRIPTAWPRPWRPGTP